MRNACMSGLIIVSLFMISTRINASLMNESKKDKNNNGSHVLNSETAEKLLVKPVCLESFSRNEKWSRIQNFPVQS